jgi:dUTP pyrophosphatase
MNPTKGELRAQRLNPSLPLGIHAPQHEGDCGWDLEAMETVVIPPMQSVDVPVNARVQLPPGTWGQMLARSSIAKRNLQVEAGVIDNGYRGPLFVVLRNMTLPDVDIAPLFGRGGHHPTRHSVTIQAGERLAQLVISKLFSGRLVEDVVEIDTARGDSGFGSTGSGLERPSPGGIAGGVLDGSYDTPWG